MSYFEYVINGELTPEYEEKTTKLLQLVNNGVAFYNFQKYWDEVSTTNAEKKERTVVLASPYNISKNLFELLSGCGLNYQVYYKQRIH